MQVPADVRTVSNMHTGRVCRGALGCEMILLSCGLTGIYFPINLLLLVCLMDYVCVCVEVSIKKQKNKVTVSMPFCVAYISPWCFNVWHQEIDHI